MKLIVVLMILFSLGCAEEAPPRQVIHNLPALPAPRNNSSDNRQSTNRNNGGLIVAALGAAALGYGLGSNNQKQCGDCTGDGVVHRGDRAAALHVRIGKRCPFCGGDGIL